MNKNLLVYLVGVGIVTAAGVVGKNLAAQKAYRQGFIDGYGALYVLSDLTSKLKEGTKYKTNLYDYQKRDRA